MLSTHQERPRELKWYHAAPMLFGDWGTSRFYVLGLAFFYSLHASFWYVLGVGVLVAAVGWAYAIVCRCYPDGGGVYSAAKHTSRQLAVIGALLLFADYIVTAALSALDGMHYLGFSEKVVPMAAIGSIVIIGLINYVGPRKAGTFALIVAIATLILTFILTIFTIPHLAEGWHNIHKPTGALGHQWINLVNVILALSGVEAIANMTGIMVPPVEKTSKKAIWPVLLEVVIFNLILAIGMNALPNTTPDGKFAHPAAEYVQADAKIDDYQKIHAADLSTPQGQEQFETFKASVGPHSTERENDIKNKVLRVMGDVFVGHWFASISGIVFGLLLISAVNTAVADMVSIQYVMSRDDELPHTLTKLNIFGVPWIALLPAIGLPVLILTFITDLEKLADLYAIGVVGAIAINLGSCSYNKEMPLKRYERTGMAVLAVIMLCIECTLAYQKPRALIFASIVLVLGLGMRFGTKTYPRLSSAIRAGLLLTGATTLLAVVVTGLVLQSQITPWLTKNVDVLATEHQAIAALEIMALALAIAAAIIATVGTQYLFRKKVVAQSHGLEVVRSGPREVTPLGTPKEQLDMSQSHVMVATRGGPRLLDFAAQYCKKTHSLLFVLYVRQVNVAFTATTSAPSIDEDPEALKVFQNAAAECSKNGIQMIPIYVVSPDVAYTILDFAATYNVEALLMGVSRKGTMLRALQGDVLTAVADSLPQDIPLLIHA